MLMPLIRETMRRRFFEPGPCPAALPADAAAAIWSGVLNSIPDLTLHVLPTDYMPHCDACFHPATGFAFFQAVMTRKIELMRVPDHVALVFAAFIIGLCAAKELRAVLLGALLGPSDAKNTAHVGWRAVELRR